MTLIEIFRESKALKRLIVQRSLQYRIPFRYICAQVGVEYTGFMSGYINTVDGSKSGFTEEQMFQILQILGITVRFNFVIDKDIDMAAQTRIAEEWFNEGGEEYEKVKLQSKEHYLRKKEEKIVDFAEKEGNITSDQ